MQELISIKQAYSVITESIKELGHEVVDLENAAGRVIAEQICADRPIPPYDRVMMDGIAISYESFTAGRRDFSIAGTQSAGIAAMEITDSNTCVEVMTGACLPRGTDAVIKVEDIKIQNGTAHLASDYVVEKYQHIHPLGSDQETGSVLVSEGTLLGATELAIAASVGHTKLKVYKSPSILLITTGDEVIPPDETPEPYQIRRSHYHAIRASIESHQLGNVTNVHVPDTKEDLKIALESGIKIYDVILLTGGISMGKFDYVAPVMQSLVGDPCFHGVAQRPGKPFAFWTWRRPPLSTPRADDDAVPAGEDCKWAIFALPGNPVSVMACIARYILPVLRKMRGENWQPPSHSLTNDTIWNAPFPGLVACSVSENQLHATPPRNSGDYTALAGCHGICELPTTKRAGSLVPYYPW
ncbi:MAG: molybdopterin molybdotransferase MoeA [Akkermansiaceae bacterium]